MAEVFHYIFSMMDISLIHLIASFAVRLCLLAANIQILNHFLALISAASGSERASRRSSSSRPRIQARRGPITYFTPNKYGVSDNCYRFEYIKQDGAWRAYILRMPDLGNRDPGGGITHRLYDSGRPYICWDRSVKSLKDIMAISRVWADRIQNYIATGERFG